MKMELIIFHMMMMMSGGVGTIDIMQLHQDIKIPGLLMVQVYCEELQPDVSRLQQ